MDGSVHQLAMSSNGSGDRRTLGTRSDWQYCQEGDELFPSGEQRRASRINPSSPRAPGPPRQPQVELRLRRDANYASTREVRPKRARVPEGLRGRWFVVSQEIVGDTATRRRATPYGLDSIEIDADGKARIVYALSEEEFKLKATPSEVGAEEKADVSGSADAVPAVLAAPLVSEGGLSLRSTSKSDVERLDEDRMRLRDPASFLLVRRGFHWINEFPLNRY